MKRIKFNGNNFSEVLALFPNAELVENEVRLYTGEELNGYKFFTACRSGQLISEENGVITVLETPIREVANWKLKAILDTMGLLPNISAAISSLPEPNKTFANYAWEYSQTVDQYSPTVKLIQTACNLTDEQVNTIFNQAESINI